VSFFGLGVSTYLAGLASLNEEILEAAAIDGAGFWLHVDGSTHPGSYGGASS